MNKKAEYINELALENAKKNNFSKALELMEENSYNFPSIQAYNNLGAFIIEFGDTINNNIDLKEKAKNYLQKALDKGENAFSYMELANVFFIEKKYDIAVKYYNKALKLRETLVTFNNLAVSEYYCGEYDKAIKHLRNAYKMSNGEIDVISELYIFMLSKKGEVDSARKILEILYKNPKYCWSVNILYLAFGCEDYKFINENYLKILNENMLEKELCKALKYVFVKKKNKQELRKFRRECIKKIFTYDMSSFLEKIDILKYLYLKKINRKDVSIEFYPQLIYECHFFGCKNHNNKW